MNKVGGSKEKNFEEEKLFFGGDNGEKCLFEPVEAEKVVVWVILVWIEADAGCPVVITFVESGSSGFGAEVS